MAMEGAVFLEQHLLMNDQPVFLKRVVQWVMPDAFYAWDLNLPMINWYATPAIPGAIGQFRINCLVPVIFQ